MTEALGMAVENTQASAKYLASACVEPAQLAERGGFSTGAYLLKMACLEFAEQQDRLQQNTSRNLNCQHHP